MIKSLEHVCDCVERMPPLLFPTHLARPAAALLLSLLFALLLALRC
jgi:hypothetical protein